MERRYKVVEGGMQDRFHRSRAKLQVIGGGYGNGKTSAACIKALRLCADYPGCNGLIARATFPRLNDTIRREFLKWAPSKWIKRMPTKDDNTITLTNGSQVNFRYVAQRGKDTEESKSNLLSATYDWIIVDQMEDPEIHHKDFMDLMGRLRGNTEYVGNDPTMPKTGPRWFIITLNPTRNWCYREIIKPLQDFQRGIVNPKLMCEVDDNVQPVLVDGKPKPILELFEGSTYENVENVGQDYIRTMLSTYTGSMRERFVFGKWGALSGLVYPSFDETQHIVAHDTMVEYMRQMRAIGFVPQVIEGYDHGLARHSCYGLFFTDDDNNVFLLDGYRVAELTVAEAATKIKLLRLQYEIDSEELRPIFADPDIFRRKSGNARSVGVTVADMFRNEGVMMARGNNEINAGIEKNWQYLALMRSHEHPITGLFPSAHFFISDRCDWFIDEITEYYFNRDGADEITDKPVDRNDHAMDMWKYAMSDRPRLARFIGVPTETPAWMAWHEIEKQASKQSPRHGAARGIR
jgi:phage terminase large subunit